MNSYIRQINVDNPYVYAFEIAGEISERDMQSMAQTLNNAFKRHENKVNILFWFKPFDGAEAGSTWDMEVIKSRFRALTNVEKYVVVGAPDYAWAMLETFSKLIPVEAHTFDANEIDQAWALLDTQPLETGSTA